MRLIQRNAEAGLAAVDSGDLQLVELLAANNAFIIDETLHKATYWRTQQGAVSDYVDRMERLAATIGRAT